MLLLLKIIVNFYQRSNESLNELIQIVIGCITDTKAIEEQPKLEASKKVCQDTCKINANNKNLLDSCLKKCDKM